MEQYNRFAVLASRPPSPAPSLHEAPPLGTFITALDLAAMGAAVNETYSPTPDHPLPTTSQPNSLNTSAVQSSQPIELITDGAQRLLGSPSYHPVFPEDYVTPPPNRRAILTIDTDLARPMAYSIPASPASPADSVMGIEFPLAVAERMRFARSPRTPSDSQTHRYSPSELMDMDNVAHIKPQEGVAPTDSRMASPISSPSTPTPTPQQLQFQTLIATSGEPRSPIDSEMGSDHASDSITTTPAEGQATPPPRFPRNSVTAAWPRARRVHLAHVPKPLSQKTRNLMSFPGGKTYRLARLMSLLTKPGRCSAEQLNLIRLGYGHLVQREPVYPILDGESVGDDEAVNAAYKLVCASLSTGFSHPNNTTDRNLHAENWFRASALVLASVLRGILSSDDIKHLGAFPPSSKSGGNCRTKGDESRTEIWYPCPSGPPPAEKIFSKAKAQARERAERRLEQWCEGWTEELIDRKVNEIYLLLITKMEEEGVRHEERLRLIEQTYAREYREALQRRTLDAIKREEREKREAAMNKVREEVENEAREWKRKHLDLRAREAIRDQIATTRQADLEKIQQEETEKLTAERRVFARRFADHQFKNWIIEEQHRRWPEVEQKAQQGTEAEALAEERNRIYPGLLTQAYKEVDAEISEQKSKRLERRQQEIDVFLERESLELIRKAAGVMGFDLVLRGNGKGPTKRLKREAKSTTVLTEVKSTDEPVAGAKRDASGRTRKPSSDETSPTAGQSEITLLVNEGAEIATELMSRALESAGSPEPINSVQYGSPSPTPDPTRAEPPPGDTTPTQKRRRVTLPDTKGTETAAKPAMPATPGKLSDSHPPRPEMVAHLATNPEVERVRGVATSAHNPANVPPTALSIEERVGGIIEEKLMPLVFLLRNLSARMEAVERGKPTTIPAPAATRPSEPAKGKAAGTSSVTVPVAKTTPEPQPVQGTAGSSPTTSAAPAAPPRAPACKGEGAGRTTSGPPAPRAPEPAKGKAPSVPYNPALCATPAPAKDGSPFDASAQTTLGTHTISPLAIAAPTAVSGAAQPRKGEFIPANRHRIKASFAVVTQASMAQNGAARSFNAQAAAAQGRTQAGKPRASSVAANTKPSVTDVVVLRDGGFQDQDKETRLRGRHPGSIVREVQAEMHRHLRLPLKILKGRWSQSSGVTGNFVYTLIGNLPFAYISSFKKYLCAPFPGSELITTEGWKWAHLRNVLLHMTSSRSGPRGNLRSSNTTILFAYEDLDGSITRAALEHGVAMFGAPVQFILSVRPLPPSRPPRWNNLLPGSQSRNYAAFVAAKTTTHGITITNVPINTGWQANATANYHAYCAERKDTMLGAASARNAATSLPPPTHVFARTRSPR
ncbi:hypothetical protein EDB84DRAFT_1598702 [Lactarius hengduanensis]|nr:hypothetical protein EDB84DRAFT_1598702 [Lactarius hengduanensis]